MIMSFFAKVNAYNHLYHSLDSHDSNTEVSQE